MVTLAVNSSPNLHTLRPQWWDSQETPSFLETRRTANCNVKSMLWVQISVLNAARAYQEVEENPASQRGWHRISDGVESHMRRRRQAEARRSSCWWDTSVLAYSVLVWTLHSNRIHIPSHEVPGPVKIREYSTLFGLRISEYSVIIRSYCLW